MHQEHKTHITQNKLKQLKRPSSVASYDLQPGSRLGLFPKEKGRLRKNKSRNKEVSGEAKQTMYIAPK